MSDLRELGINKEDKNIFRTMENVTPQLNPLEIGEKLGGKPKIYVNPESLQSDLRSAAMMKYRLLKGMRFELLELLTSRDKKRIIRLRNQAKSTLGPDEFTRQLISNFLSSSDEILKSYIPKNGTSPKKRRM